jgi:cytoskeletal protein CcmA (bactofilin family)
MANVLEAGRVRVPESPRQRAEPPIRRLVVGSGIAFAGEIASCDSLVIEGTVRANIAGCREMQIAEGGLFVGTASVFSAEIGGRLEGELTVAERLLVHPTGQVAATVRYRQLQVECGGEVSGDIRVAGADKSRGSNS